jgi:hypothetical protein
MIQSRSSALASGAVRRENTGMRALIGLLVAVAVAAAVYYFAFSKTATTPDGTEMSTPTQAISLTGVKNDLNGIAQAERAYFAREGKYATPDELIQAGDLSMKQSGRDGYTYTVEASAGGFTVTARHPATPGVTWPVLQIDQTMELRTTQ